MIGSVFFIFNRMVEITFLIPIVGMLVRPFPAHFSPTEFKPRKSGLTHIAGLVR